MSNWIPNADWKKNMLYGNCCLQTAATKGLWNRSGTQALKCKLQIKSRAAKRSSCQLKSPNAALGPVISSHQSGAVSVTVSGEFASALWYVVHTQPRAERQAICHLEMQGYRVFCPRYLRTVRHARKAKSVLSPLFPNYLFVRLDISRDQWRRINGTRGVVRLLTQGEMPQPVPYGIVDGLQAQMRADGAMDWTPKLKTGAAVRIADGPFAEFLGTLEYIDAAGRVRVLLDLLGRSVSVSLRCEVLIPAT